MDIDGTEEREDLTEADGRAGMKSCGRFALGLVILLLPGIAPASFFFGLMSTEAAANVLGRPLGQGIIDKLIVLAAMATAILLSAVIVLFLTTIVHRIAHDLARRMPFAARKRVI